ncbi:MAG: hypothetical protein AAGD92_02720 [Pseudomonadota bacterium]
MTETFSIEDGLIILRRRIWYFLIPVIAIAPIGAAIVLAMPAKYTARGTILVESQQIPVDYVRSTINAYAQERIQTIRQRVMTVNQALEVADKHNVFPKNTTLSESERAQKMRDGLNVSLITVGRKSRSGDGTIAFTVSYTHRDPNKAYLVANEFMTLFLSEDVRTRTAGASNTTEFFEREAQKLLAQVSGIEQRISEFKVQNADALPEHLNMHLDMLERANRQYVTSERSNEQLEEEKQFLASQLVSGAEATGGLSAQLQALESQLALLRATYYDGYPEIRQSQDQISAIKRRMRPSTAIQTLRQELALADTALTDLERSEEADSEAVAAAEARVEEARRKLSDQISSESRAGGDASNAQIEARIALIDNRIRMNDRRTNALSAEIEDLQTRIARTPAVERDLATLTRDYDNLFGEYRELRAKQQDAQLAENLEENQQAEKFSILEPARRPHQPSSPDRPKLLVFALFAAFAIGGACAMLAELLFSTIRGRVHVSGVIEEHPIAVIPYIPGEPKKRSVLGFLRRRGVIADTEPQPV